MCSRRPKATSALKRLTTSETGLKTVTRLFVAGKIGKERLIREGFDVVEGFEYPISEPTYYRAREISDYIHDLYETEQLDLTLLLSIHKWSQPSP